jgi:small-conductance mechanosensitive channel
MTQAATEPGAASGTERRISHLTLLFGFAAALAMGYFRGRVWGVGLAIGSGLAWFNFRWLGRSLDALVAASTSQAGQEKPLVPLSTYFLAFFRYALIGLAVYVIFIYLHVPLASLLVGLCALGVAVIAASAYEILNPME